MKTKSNNTHGFYQHGQWFFKLPDPLSSMAYYPLDSKSISDYLHVSQRTALRICKGESTLSHGELVYLQVMVLGYIPDARFSKLRFFVRDGKLVTHTSPSFSLSAGEIIEFALLRNYYHNALKSNKQVIL